MQVTPLQALLAALDWMNTFTRGLSAPGFQTRQNGDSFGNFLLLYIKK